MCVCSSSRLLALLLALLLLAALEELVVVAAGIRQSIISLMMDCPPVVTAGDRKESEAARASLLQADDGPVVVAVAGDKSRPDCEQVAAGGDSAVLPQRGVQEGPGRGVGTEPWAVGASSVVSAEGVGVLEDILIARS